MSRFINIYEKPKINAKAKRFRAIRSTKGSVCITDHDADTDGFMALVDPRYSRAILALLNDNPHDTLNLKPTKKKPHAKPIN